MAQNARFRGIDGLRGIAASLVMEQHIITHPIFLLGFPALRSAILAVTTGWFDIGRFGVVVFFLISGYVIPFSFKEDSTLKTFFIHRILRLYPAYWLSIAAFSITTFFLGEKIPASTLLYNVTMFQRLFNKMDLIGVYWTLFIELIFYGLCCIAAAFGMIKNTKYVTISMYALALLLLFGSIRVYLTGERLPLAPLFGLGIMYLGSQIRLARVEGKLITKPLLVFSILAILTAQVASCYFAFSHIHEQNITTWYGQAISIAAALLVFSIISSKSNMNIGSLIFLGEVSYSLYLFHQIVILITSYWFESTWEGATAFFLTSNFIAAFVAWVVYRNLELPCIALGRKLTAI